MNNKGKYRHHGVASWFHAQYEINGLMYISVYYVRMTFDYIM